MKLLTKGEEDVLKALAAGEELECFVPGGWWIDTNQVGGRIGMSLLRKMALHEEQFGSDSHRIYTINETGQELLAGKRPAAWDALAKRMAADAAHKLAQDDAALQKLAEDFVKGGKDG